MNLPETLLTQNSAKQHKPPLDSASEVKVQLSFRTSCFRVADRWVHRLTGLANAVHKGFWLGCLTPGDLNALTAQRYSASTHFTSRPYVESGLFDWETAPLERYFCKGSRILVAAAGTGREVLALRKGGFSADGFECNPALLRIGQDLFAALGHSRPVSFSLPDSVPPGPPEYDGLLVGWGGYTHIPTRARRVAFLQALRQRAVPGAPLMLSLFTRQEPSRYDRLTYGVAKICGSLFRPVDEPPEPGDDLESGDFTHRFTPGELESELQAATFRLVYFSEEAQLGVAVAFAE